MCFFDAHLHLVHSSLPEFNNGVKYTGITCSLSRDEFIQEEKIIDFLSANPSINFYRSFGIHPQNPDINNLAFLEMLLKENKIDAVGECGFDLYTEEFKKNINEQKTVWNEQINLAIEYDKPVIIHGRKCTDLFFKDINKLKKIKSIVFHSWAGTYIEANSLLKKGVNAFFSFGKPLLKGKKTVLECVKNLETSRIFFETDAPYQTLKGESETHIEDIVKIYQKAFDLRNEIFYPDFTRIFL